MKIIKRPAKGFMKEIIDNTDEKSLEEIRNRMMEELERKPISITVVNDNNPTHETTFIFSPPKFESDVVPDKYLLEILDKINNMIIGTDLHPSVRNENAQIFQDTEFAIYKIQSNLRIISDNKKNRKMIDSCCKDMEFICGGFELDETYRLKNVFRREYFDWHLKELKLLLEKALNIVKSNSDEGIKKLNEDFTNKWLYFCGVEDGDDLVYVDKIFFDYENDLFCLKGVHIELTDDNCQPAGVVFNDTERLPFNELRYYDDEIVTAEDLYKWLEDLKYSDTPKRVLSNEEARELILKNLCWNFEGINNQRFPHEQIPNLFKEYE